MYGSVSSSTDATSELCSGCWELWTSIKKMTGDGTETECCGRMCNTRTQSSLRGSVIFCSIKCVIVTKLGGEARILEISITHKSFLEIPPREG